MHKICAFRRNLSPWNGSVGWLSIIANKILFFRSLSGLFVHQVLIVFRRLDQKSEKRFSTLGHVPRCHFAGAARALSLAERRLRPNIVRMRRISGSFLFMSDSLHLAPLGRGFLRRADIKPDDVERDDIKFATVVLRDFAPERSSTSEEYWGNLRLIWHYDAILARLRRTSVSATEGSVRTPAGIKLLPWKVLNIEFLILSANFRWAKAYGNG